MNSEKSASLYEQVERHRSLRQQKLKSLRRLQTWRLWRWVLVPFVIIALVLLPLIYFANLGIQKNRYFKDVDFHFSFISQDHPLEASYHGETYLLDDPEGFQRIVWALKLTALNKSSLRDAQLNDDSEIKLTLPSGASYRINLVQNTRDDVLIRYDDEQKHERYFARGYQIHHWILRSIKQVKANER